MTREEIIRGLECHTIRPDGLYSCDTCPYTVMITDACEDALNADALALLTTGAVWNYYLNDEGKARWKCSNCGKICRRNPHDKQYCSNCGRRTRMEA